MRTEVEQLKQKQAKKIEASNKGNTHTNDKKLDKEEQGIANGLSQAIVKEKPNVKWDDVGGLEQAKKVLQ